MLEILENIEITREIDMKWVKILCHLKSSPNQISAREITVFMSREDLKHFKPSPKVTKNRSNNFFILI